MAQKPLTKWGPLPQAQASPSAKRRFDVESCIKTPHIYYIYEKVLQSKWTCFYCIIKSPHADPCDPSLPQRKKLPNRTFFRDSNNNNNGCSNRAIEILYIASGWDCVSFHPFISGWGFQTAHSRQVADRHALPSARPRRPGGATHVEPDASGCQ